MAPTTFPKAMDLSGRTPIYRLTKNTAPPPPPSQPPRPVANSQAQPSHSPYQSPYPSSQSAAEDGPHTAVAQQSAQPTPDSDARNSPMNKRRGRKLQEHEVLTLVNFCLEFQSIYVDNRMRFWYCVATSLKRQIKRNFSWQSCRQIVDELVSERRERMRDVASGKFPEQPTTELRIATDKWIAVSDRLDAQADNCPPLQTLKRPRQPDFNGVDPSADKRWKPQDQVIPPVATQSVVPVMAPPTPISPAMMDIQSLRLDLQGLRRDMLEMRQELNGKLDLVIKTLQRVKELNESRTK